VFVCAGYCVVSDASTYILLNNIVNILRLFCYQGTPVKLNVDGHDGRYITAYGQGLISGGSGEKLEFYVTGSSSKCCLDYVIGVLRLCRLEPHCHWLVVSHVYSEA